MDKEKCDFKQNFSVHKRRPSRSSKEKKINLRNSSYENRRRRHKHQHRHENRHREKSKRSYHRNRKEYSRSRKRSTRGYRRYDSHKDYQKKKAQHFYKQRKSVSQHKKRHYHVERRRSFQSKRKEYRDYSKNKKISCSISNSHYDLNKNSSSSPSSCSCSSSSKKSEFGHYKYKFGTCIKSNYQITSLLGDGTFGRVLECKNLQDDTLYAVKVIRPVKRYIESAKIEADIILDILAKDKSNQSQCVKMLEYFTFKEHSKEYMALVFEKLGKSLYEFLKSNNYRGYPITQVQSFAKQIFQGIGFLHEKIELTHTDLKPENLLLKSSTCNVIKVKDLWPKQVVIKEARNRSESPSTRSYSKEVDTEDGYKVPLDTNIKIIDFGGATYRYDRHSGIINTRQYRSPEVILGCCDWDEKSDIWSIACILAELYTGDLLFPTHDNEEHLCFIEKISGPIQYWMAERSKKEFRKLFNLLITDSELTEGRINYFKLSKIEKVQDSVQHLETLDEIILDEHKIFKEFLKFLLVIDPHKRPSCAEALEHQFFLTDFSQN